MAAGDFLRRFRFHGVPGAPAPAGVPVDRSRALEAELAPVFALLQPEQSRVAQLIREASAEAAHRRAEWANHVERLLDEARSEAVAVRAQAAARVLAEAEGQRRALVTEAREEAQRVSRVAAERTPMLVEEVVRRVLAMGEPPPGSGRGGASPDPTSGQSEGRAS